LARGSFIGYGRRAHRITLVLIATEVRIGFVVLYDFRVRDEVKLRNLACRSIRMAADMALGIPAGLVNLVIVAVPGPWYARASGRTRESFTRVNNAIAGYNG
jgi:hypothetical protein